MGSIVRHFLLEYRFREEDEDTSKEALGALLRHAHAEPPNDLDMKLLCAEIDRAADRVPTK